MSSRQEEWEGEMLGIIGSAYQDDDPYQAAHIIYLEKVAPLLAEVDRLRAQVKDVEAVWSMWRDDEDGSMPWKFVRDMDVIFPEVANRD